MVKGTAELERPVPLYMQVVRQLRARIASGELAEGDRIPSQREMMAHWRISMQTASKVIGALKTEGLAIASAGRDTIVAPGAATRIAAAAAGTAHAPAEPEPGPSLDVKATAVMTAAPADVAEILPAPPGNPPRQGTTGQRNGHLVSPGHRRQGTPPCRQRALRSRGTRLHRRGCRSPRGASRRGERRHAC